MPETETRAQPRSRFSSRGTPPPADTPSEDIGALLGETGQEDAAPVFSWNRDLVAAPKGPPLWMTPDLVAMVEAIWHATRRYDGKAMRWVPHGYWAIRNTGGVPLNFEPLGWALA